MTPLSTGYFSADTILLGIFVISHVRGTSENFWQADNKFNIRTVFKTKCTLRGLLMTYALERACLIFSVHVACAMLLKQADRQEYISREHGSNLRQDLRYCPTNWIKQHTYR